MESYFPEATAVAEDEQASQREAPARCIASQTAISTVSRSNSPVLRQPMMITCKATLLLAGWFPPFFTSGSGSLRPGRAGRSSRLPPKAVDSVPGTVKDLHLPLRFRSPALEGNVSLQHAAPPRRGRFSHTHSPRHRILDHYDSLQGLLPQVHLQVSGVTLSLNS